MKSRAGGTRHTWPVAALIALSIALGVAVIIGTRLAIDNAAQPDRPVEPGATFDWGRPAPVNRGAFENLWGTPPQAAAGFTLDPHSLTPPTFDDAFTATYVRDDAALAVEYSLDWTAYPNNIRTWRDEAHHHDATCGLEEERPACMVVGQTGVLEVHSSGDVSLDEVAAATAELAAALAETADDEALWGGYPPPDLEQAPSLRVNRLPERVLGFEGSRVDDPISQALISDYDMGTVTLRVLLDREHDDYVRWIMIMQDPTWYGDVVCDAQQPVRCVTVGHAETLGIRIYGHMEPERAADLLGEVLKEF